MKQAKLFEIIARLTIKQVKLKKQIATLTDNYTAKCLEMLKIIAERDQYANNLAKAVNKIENPQGAAYRIHALKLEVDQLKARIAELEGDK